MVGPCQRDGAAVKPRETYHIEVLASEDEAGARGEDTVSQRISVRTFTVEAAKERALTLFARARAPQRSGAPAEAVRVIDGAGTEVFRWSRFDEPA
ncbi:hypothetical protein ASF49_09490 [Methylobacterium sp. Leaf104]|nr:hypothetical protein ASF49_09490 [Methylobacterium sp. Leaf104]MCI9880574.1 hypothetical protein [Methylobacterium goesingense]